MKKVFTGLIITCFCFLLLISCEKSSSPKKCSQKHFRMSLNANPRTLDPRKQGDFASCVVIYMVFDGLTKTAMDGTMKEALAESIDISKDQKVYTFHIRKNAFWSDGYPITAHDFVYSWKTAIDPSFPCLCASMFFPLKNAEAIALKKLPVDSLGVKALDDKTLLVELENPTPYFLELVSFPALYAVPKHFVEKKESWDLAKTEFPVSGPFSVDSYQENHAIVVRKNPNYWDQAQVEVDQISLYIIPDGNTAFQMYEKGDIDWIGTKPCAIPQEVFSEIKTRPEYSCAPSAGSAFVAFNLARKPFTNKNIRKAFSCAIDRDILVHKVTRGEELVATRLIPPMLFEGQNRNIIPPYGETLAKEYLQKGLEELGLQLSDLPSVTLLCGMTVEKSVAEALQYQWKKVLGISVKIDQMDYTSCLQKMHSHQFDLALGSWIAQIADPINLLERFKYKKNPKNYAGWEDARFIRLLNASSREASQEARRQILEEAERIFVEELPITPLYHYNFPMLTKPHIANLSPNPKGGLRFDLIKINPHEH